MIQTYDDLYKTIESSIEHYSKTPDAMEMAFKKNDNKTCTLTNKRNGKYFVFMFAQFGHEYKVGFAYYVPDQYGGAKSPEWIEDIFNHEFNGQFVYTLINEHLVHDGTDDSGWR